MKIPKKYREFYAECATMLRRIIEKKSTVKREAYKNKNNPTEYLAFLDKLVQNYDLLEKIIEAHEFLRKDKFYSVILCYEILNSKINSQYWKKKFEETKGDSEILHVSRQKFIRLNTLKASEDDLKELEVEATKIPNVYKLKSNTNFAQNKLFKEGKLIVQNIASCLPAFLLNPKEGSTVIDACSAPGNKTSHLSAIMNNTGKIFAVEVDKYRFNLMKSRLNRFGIKNVKCLNEDFFEVSKDEYKKVDYILVDPTCSGSGIHDYYNEDDERTEGLQKFQIKLLKHAMTFSADKIVYSTCSINRKEGEDVVNEAIKESDYEILDLSKEFKHLEESEIKFSESFIRCEGSKDKETIGFFAAVLIKKTK
ncbi:putative 28S rRNA (cytosine-C(5))-methyltransferase [Nosema granulosis]|uniref:28S rRNA (Cytosine-C(5))-methyltransferase n=1 Tax=Nosema granulosis TaxID=83296 RepID=A0A9P6L0Q4_9MICR|nr:putative 28S rRNA (cytosine-C(5))-methyltransferase [Nosema granulosis]